MLGQRTLLINPPPVDGVRFTRQGRCQEREEVLGTSKPPYSLVLLASLLRARGHAVALFDQNAEGVTTDAVIASLERKRFEPTLIVFCSTFPTLEADVREAAQIKARYDAPLFCFGPHASCAPAESMLRATAVDGMIVGEPEDGMRALADLDSMDELSSVPSLTFRRGAEIIAHRELGVMADFTEMSEPAWDELNLGNYRLPLINEPYVLVETSRGCPYTCDFCVAPIQQGHKFRERSAESVVAEIEDIHCRYGVNAFYLWGDTVTLKEKTFTHLCKTLAKKRLPIRWFSNGRADDLANPEYVQILKDSGCWMVAMGIESGEDDLRDSMSKRLEAEQVRLAVKNLRKAGIRSFGFFIYGHPDDSEASMERTTEFACTLGLDFAAFYPVVPYPGTEMHATCQSRGLLPKALDWSKLEYNYYLLNGNGLSAENVMPAISRARRRFFFRPSYLLRRAPDVARIFWSKPGVTFRVLGSLLKRGAGDRSQKASTSA